MLHSRLSPFFVAALTILFSLQNVRAANILFVVDSLTSPGIANMANDRDVVSRLQSQGHTVTVGDDTDANLATLFAGKDLIIISSSVSSTAQPLANLCVSDLRTRNVPILDYEPALYDELLLQTSVDFGNAANQTTLYIAAGAAAHPLAAGNCEGPLVVTTTATGPVFSTGSTPPTYGTDAILIASNATPASANIGRPAIWAFEAGSRLADNSTVTPARRISFFWNATTAVGGFNASAFALLDAAVTWALGTPTPPNAPIVITAQPASVTVKEPGTATFLVRFTGAAPHFIQWRRGNGAGGFTNIPGATCPSYSTAAVIPADNGAVFSVVVSNNLGSVVSSNAVLTVLRDTNGPVLLSAIGNAAGDQVFLTFSELLDPATGGEISNYRIVAVGGPDELLLSSVTLTNGTNVIIVNDPSTPRNPGQNYAVNVSSVRDIVGNSISPDPFVLQIRPDVVLIGFDSDNEWKYNIGPDLTGTGWETKGYDDSAWLSGSAGLGLDAAPNGVPIRTTLPYNSTNITTYFRKHFILPGGTNGVTLTLRDVVEDGAVYYLNGQEVLRNRMPAGAVTFATLATGAPEPTPITGPFVLSITNLVSGENVLAAEVHQSGTASSDLEFAAELTANVAGFGLATNTAPQLNFARNANGTITLTWSAPGFCLQETAVLASTAAATAWTNSTRVSGTPFTPTGATRFYRLSNRCN